MSKSYHLNTKEIRDDKWKEKNIIINNFINILVKRYNEFNDYINSGQFSQICNNILSYYGYEIFANMPLHLFIDYSLNNNVDKKYYKK